MNTVEQQTWALAISHVEKERVDKKDIQKQERGTDSGKRTGLQETKRSKP